MAGPVMRPAFLMLNRLRMPGLQGKKLIPALKGPQGKLRLMQKLRDIRKRKGILYRPQKYLLYQKKACSGMEKLKKTDSRVRQDRLKILYGHLLRKDVLLLK